MLIVCCITLALQVNAQNLYLQLQEIYRSESKNIDSIDKVIKNIDCKKINLQSWYEYLIKENKDDSLIMFRVKTLHLATHYLKNIGIQNDSLSIQFKLLIWQIYEQFYLFSPIDFFRHEVIEFNKILNSDHFDETLTQQYYKDKNMVNFYEKVVSIKPKFLTLGNLRMFRKYNISQYNDLILKYILKSPDSVDFSNYKTVANESDFMNSMPWEAIYTLAWFDDIRIAPYLEKLGKTIGLRINTTFYKILLTYQDLDINKKQKYDISLRLRLWFIKGLLQNKEIFQTIRIIDMFSTGIEIVPFDFYIIGNGIYGFFSMQYKDDYNKLKTIKSRDEQYKYVENFIEKKLKELKKEKK